MKSRRWIIGGIGGVVVIIIAWHLLIDLSWFVEECPDCGSDWSAIEYRVVNSPVSKYRRANTMMLELVCTDLGVPAHIRTSSDDYTPAMSARVKALAKENPKLSDEFHQRVLAEHDYEYWHTFAKRMKSP